MERNLEGRIALVTGGGEGIGLAIARRLALAGARVAIADLNPTALEQATGTLTDEGLTVAGFTANVSQPQSVHTLAAAVERHWGAVEILVNNAGITGGSTEVRDFDPAVWDEVFAVNARGVFLCCQAVLPGMLAAKRGRIVNVASIAGKEGNPRLSAYSASKAAVIGFTKSLAKEVAREGILVNAISPAVIQTRILDQVSQATRDYMIGRIPMGRVGQPEEVAALVHWLSGDDCSFTTGQCVDISGGRATY
ncbi:MAG TPA: SDR family NAD(P)-dependent oxidoreductase [Chloroflexota bacterium]|nr:SDR family NAD(P)-dependent oxidoreductase [Chloroflexota bacterium]